mmetsp:Transcript_31612/g.32195  ORF Transcript_31612/g.32195 Transcript_31612/m.32195 type:complete len:324 (-) Transcript_31612:141-1112(-)
MADATFSQSLDRLKESFLWAAAQGGNTQDCESLIDIGADVNWRNHEGDTPLLAACRRGHIETANVLIVHGADVNAIGDDSYTPLHIACRRGNYELLSILLESNADIFLQTLDGETAMDIAQLKGYEDIYNRLIQYLSSHSSSSGTNQTAQNNTLSLQNSLLDRLEASAAQVQGGGGGGGGVPTAVFVSISFKLETAQAERVAVDEVVKSTPQEGASSLEVHNQAGLVSLRTLSAMIEEILVVLQTIESGVIPVDHSLLRRVSKITHQLPTLDSIHFQRHFNEELTDCLMTTYLASTTKTLQSVHELAEAYSVAYNDRFNSKNR